MGEKEKSRNIENEEALRKEQPEIDTQEQNVEEEISQTSQEVSIDEYKALERERDELISKLQRTMADFQNFRKRAAQERKETIDRTELNTIETYLFPIIDDLDRAIQAAIDHGYDENDPLLHGVDMVRQHAFKMLAQQNIEPIDALGKPFDPLVHEAIMEQPTDAVPEKTVLQVISRGYMQNGKTIRPAKVIVSKALDNDKNNQQSNKENSRNCEGNNENNDDSNESQQ